MSNFCDILSYYQYLYRDKKYCNSLLHWYIIAAQVSLVDHGASFSQQRQKKANAITNLATNYKPASFWIQAQDQKSKESNTRPHKSVLVKSTFFWTYLCLLSSSLIAFTSLTMGSDSNTCSCALC